MSNDTQTPINDSRSAIEEQLPKEMLTHTYEIMNRVEDTHWWFAGRRAILESFLRQIAEQTEFRGQKTRVGRPGSGDMSDETGDGPQETGPESQSLLARILDVGCGTGANLEMLSRFGDAEGVDVSDEAIEYCRIKGLKVRKGIAEELPFEDSAFDLVTALDVVEHLDDDISGLKELHRVTRSGGHALVFVPAFMWLWGVQDDISHHRIRYTRKQITERLEKAGFTVERATYANLTFFLPILAGRVFMRMTGIKPESENNVNVSALNGLFGKLFGAERHFLKFANLPIGVSIVIVARKY